VKILVSIKQVPDVAALALDPATRCLVRTNVTLFANPYDLRAIALAARLKQEQGAQIVAATMGPPSAVEVLALARAAGADRCILVSDPALAGSDTLITARVLARLIERERPDLALMGQYSVDSETAQVPVETAELLGWPCLAAVRSFAIDPASALIHATCETDDGSEAVTTTAPAVVTTAERLIAPLKIGEEALAVARTAAIEPLTAGDLGLSSGEVGLAASPTRVGAIRPMTVERRAHVFATGSVEERAAGAARLALDRGLAPAPSSASSWPTSAAAAVAELWVLPQTADGELEPVSFELLAAARRLAASARARTVAVLLGAPGIERIAHNLGLHGADRVLAVADPRLEPFTAEPWRDALDGLLERHPAPLLILAGATPVGRGTLGRLAARRHLGMTGDCIGIEREADGTLAHLKPAFGGNVLAPIYCATAPQLATLIPGSVRPLAANPGHRAELRMEAVPIGEPRVAVVARDRSASAAATALDHAALVVCVGNAISGPEQIPAVREQLDALESATGLPGALAATRRVADAGWLPRQIQVGLTGRAIAPHLYIGVGVRGAAYHMVGIRQARTIVAINSDADAPIFAQADIGIVGDWQAVLPALARAFGRQSAARAAAKRPPRRCHDKRGLR
jgi:electron transfer flavoprotein alpha subunit